MTIIKNTISTRDISAKTKIKHQIILQTVERYWDAMIEVAAASPIHKEYKTKTLGGYEYVMYPAHEMLLMLLSSNKFESVVDFKVNLAEDGGMRQQYIHCDLTHSI